MDLLSRPGRGNPERLALLPGSFNPLTCAHLALARAALDVVDEVALIVPRAFPHKSYQGASLEQRLEMMQAAAGHQFAIGISEGGLFVEMVREAREHYGGAEIFVACGRDAAVRYITWDYGSGATIQQMLREFKLLVAPREGSYSVPPGLAHAIRTLAPIHFDECAATRVREAIASGAAWRHMVPEQIHTLVDAIYSQER